MTDLISLINASITITKGLLEIDRKWDKSVYKSKLADLTLQLAQMKLEAADMVLKIRNLEAKLEEKDSNPLAYDGSIYVDQNNESYCPACYDSQGKRIHLKNRSEGRHSILYTCPICHASFE